MTNHHGNDSSVSYYMYSGKLETCKCHSAFD